MPELRSAFLMRLSADPEDPQVLGDTPLGMRRIMYMKRGLFSGPRLEGQVLPGGGDWVLQPFFVAEPYSRRAGHHDAARRVDPYLPRGPG